MKKSDVEIACNMIKRKREYGKKSRISKTIYIPLFKEDNCIVYSVLCAGYNILTNNYQFPGFSLVWKSKSISPTTYQKLKCINKRGLEYLEQNRTQSVITYLKNKRKFIRKHSNFITFHQTLDDRTYLKEYIMYNYQTGSINYSSKFLLQRKRVSDI